jgi:hypothetical protein
VKKTIISILFSIIVGIGLAYLMNITVDANNPYRNNGSVWFSAIITAVIFGEIAYIIITPLINHILPKFENKRITFVGHFVIMLILIFPLGLGINSILELKKFAEFNESPKAKLNKINQDVCSGIAHPELSSFKSPGFHPAYASDISGFWEDWIPKDIKDLQVVICKESDSKKVTQSCQYYQTVKDGIIFPISPRNIEFEYTVENINLRIISVTDLKEIASFTVNAKGKFVCPDKINIESSKNIVAGTNLGVTDMNLLGEIEKYLTSN